MIFIYWSLSITSLITANSRDMASHPCICNNASAFRQEIIEFFYITICPSTAPFNGADIYILLSHTNSKYTCLLHKHFV